MQEGVLMCPFLIHLIRKIHGANYLDGECEGVKCRRFAWFFRFVNFGISGWLSAIGFWLIQLLLLSRSRQAVVSQRLKPLPEWRKGAEAHYWRLAFSG